jgi:hypothetical protein
VNSSVGALRRSPEAAGGDVQPRLRSRSGTCHPRRRRRCPTRAAGPLAALKTLLEG